MFAIPTCPAVVQFARGHVGSRPPEKYRNISAEGVVSARTDGNRWKQPCRRSIEGLHISLAELQGETEL